ncbi:MAG: hypothetical protein P8J86_09000 [Phycisphaerales bacterium]|nr:hypothetical protein [Phycisphaerales bacterium]
MSFLRREFGLRVSSFWFAVMIAALLPLASCITPGQIPTEPQPLPEIVVEQFMQALASGNDSRVHSLMDHRQAGQQLSQTELDAITHRWSANGGSGDVMGVKINGHSAVVAVMRMTADGQFTSDLTPVYLNEIDDLWRISPLVTKPNLDSSETDALEKWYVREKASLTHDVSEQD